MCTPSACSSSSARPVRRLTDTTSGTSLIRRSATAPRRSESAIAMPGVNTSDTSDVPSLKVGRKLFGNRHAPSTASAIAVAAAASTSGRRGSAQSSSPE
jgi:hypothetical protein